MYEMFIYGISLQLNMYLLIFHIFDKILQDNTIPPAILASLGVKRQSSRFSTRVPPPKQLWTEEERQRLLSITVQLLLYFVKKIL